MKDIPRSSPEPSNRASQRNTSQGLPSSTTSSPIVAQADDLTKNQWIPFASTALFFLLTAIIVSVVGGLAIRLAEPTLVPTGIPTLYVPPSPTITATVPGTLSPTVAISTPTPIMLRVLPSVANVRAASSPTAKIIGQIKKDTLATPLVRSVDGRWLLVVSSDNGMTGWVANELFEIISGDPKILPTVAPVSPSP